MQAVAESVGVGKHTPGTLGAAIDTPDDTPDLSLWEAEEHEA